MKVLICEDDKIMLKALKFKLLQEKYNVTTEFTGHNHYYQYYVFSNVNYYTISSVRFNQGDKSIMKVTVKGSDITYEVIPVHISSL